MSRLIDADALRNVFEDMANDRFNKSTATSWGRVFEESADIVDEQPTIEERKRGEWIEENRRPKSMMFYCSECHRTAYDPQNHHGGQKRCRYAFCPNCGAEMRKVEDNERA